MCAQFQHLTDLSGVGDPSLFGDLDGDGDNDFTDFRLFQTDYDAYNGVGSFQAMLTSIPEPTSGLILEILGLAVSRLRRTRHDVQ